VIKAKVHEFDLNKRVWEIPAARMKSEHPHTVPLTPRMVEILQDVASRHDQDYAFINPQTGRRLSNMAMAEFLKAISPNVTVHGFRSSMRDWLAEQTSFPHDLCEMALAHAVKDGTVKAYKRSDLLEKRRALMASWDTYCGTPRPVCDVVPLRKAKV
jgi:integrase